MHTLVKEEKTGTKKSQFLSSINFIRGAASLGVCAYHMSNGNSEYLAPDNIVKIVGGYGWVTVFFIISGFLLPYSMNNRAYAFPGSTGNFLLKRIVRIEPPYIIAVIMAIALNYVSTLLPTYRGQEFSFSLTNFLLHIGYLNVFFDMPWFNPVFWTLAIEFQFYLLIAVLFPLLIHPNKLVRIGVLVGFGAMGFLFRDSRFVFHHSPLFIIGILMFQYKAKLFSNREFLLCFALAVALACLQLGERNLFTSVFTCVIVLFFQFQSKVADFLGKVSYSLYLTHVPIGGRIINFSMNYIESQVARGITVFVAMGVCILFAWVFYLVVEKHFLNLSNRIKY